MVTTLYGQRVSGCQAGGSDRKERRRERSMEEGEGSFYTLHRAFFPCVRVAPSRTWASEGGR